jgi:CCR4-NOT transcription complex subunit 6
MKLTPQFHMPSLFVDAHNPPPSVPSDVHLTYAWFRGPKMETVQQGMVAHSRPEIKSSEWTKVGSRRNYTTTEQDSNHLLKFVIYAEHKPGIPYKAGETLVGAPLPLPDPSSPPVVGKYLYYVAPTTNKAPTRAMVPRKTDFETDLLPEQYSFTAMSWNVLARRYTDARRLSNCPDYALAWDYRKELILDENLLNYEPDIVSLQECEDDAYDTFYLPQLKAEGYSSLFEKRGSVLHDGCAIFYKRSKFRPISHCRVDYDDLEQFKDLKPLQYQSATFLTHNVALIALLEIKASESHLENVYGKRYVYFVNTHNFWDPQAPHVKLLQGHYLMEKLSAFQQKMASTKEIPLTTPVILMGDINSTHKSSLYEYLTTGAAHSANSVYSSTEERTLIKNLLRTKPITHHMKLRNAHQPHGEAVTNLTINFAGCLDYIFHTPNAVPSATLENPTTSESEALRDSILTDDYMGCIPNPAYPSDHLPLMVQFRLSLDMNSTL